jgi:hypothetical protein
VVAAYTLAFFALYASELFTWLNVRMPSVKHAGQDAVLLLQASLHRRSRVRTSTPRCVAGEISYPHLSTDEHEMDRQEEFGMLGMMRSARWWLVGLLALATSLATASGAAAQEVPGSGSWSPAAGAAGDNTYAGFIDLPASGPSVPQGSTIHVSGWAVDTSADGWAGIDDVQVLNGSTVLAHGSVGGNRPDVAAATGNPYWAASGFDALVPSSGLPGGSVTLTVAVHTPAKGSWSQPLSVTIGGGGAPLASPATSGLVLRIVTPADGDNVQANNNGIISGVAYDTRTRAELGVGVDRVQVYLDGPRGSPGSQNLGTATMTGNTWSLAWEPTKYDHVPHHTLFIYAHSNVTGEERLVNVEINIVH